MKCLVEIQDNIPVVESLNLVDVLGIQHRSIYRLIVKHEDKLKHFGEVRFGIASSDSGQNQAVAYLNESQAILLLTYTRSNASTDQFRIKLVQDFVAMREYIRKQEIFRLAGKEIRKELTDSLKESGEDDKMHGHAYSNYTRLVYACCGLSDKKKEYGSIDGFRDTLSPEELKNIKTAESIIKACIDIEKDYSQIKSILQPLFVKEIGRQE